MCIVDLDPGEQGRLIYLLQMIQKQIIYDVRKLSLLRDRTHRGRDPVEGVIWLTLLEAVVMTKEDSRYTGYVMLK